MAVPTESVALMHKESKDFVSKRQFHQFDGLQPISRDTNKNRVSYKMLVDEQKELNDSFMHCFVAPTRRNDIR